MIHFNDCVLPWKILRCFPIFLACPTLTSEFVLLFQILVPKNEKRQWSLSHLFCVQDSPLRYRSDVEGVGVAVSDLLPPSNVPGGECHGVSPHVDPDHAGVAAVVEQHKAGLQGHAHWPRLPGHPGGGGGALYHAHLVTVHRGHLHHVAHEAPDKELSRTLDDILNLFYKMLFFVFTKSHVFGLIFSKIVCFLEASDEQKSYICLKYKETILFNYVN